MADTVVRNAYPYWWAGATTIRVSWVFGTSTSFVDCSPNQIELLSAGVAFDVPNVQIPTFVPWHNVVNLSKQA